MKSNVRQIPAPNFRHFEPPFRNPDPSVRAAPQRLIMTPIPWGKRDSELGKAVCRSVLDTTPPMVIPFQPRTHARTRAFLRAHGVHC